MVVVLDTSNSIEGIVTTKPRLRELTEDKTTPKNRDEEENLGYRNVLELKIVVATTVNKLLTF